MSMPLRTVADRARTTTGAIQHPFGNRDGLVLAVLQRHGERTLQRLQGLGTEQPPPPLRVARAILLQFLPLDDERREEALVAHAFEGLTAGDEGMQRANRQQHRLLASILAEHLPLAESASVDLLLTAVGGLRT